MPAPTSQPLSPDFIWNTVLALAAKGQGKIKGQAYNACMITAGPYVVATSFAGKQPAQAFFATALQHASKWLLDIAATAGRKKSLARIIHQPCASRRQTPSDGNLANVLETPCATWLGPRLRGDSASARHLPAREPLPRSGSAAGELSGLDIFLAMEPGRVNNADWQALRGYFKSLPIKSVRWGCSHPGGGLGARLKSLGIKVETARGDARKKAQRLNEAYVHSQKYKRPFVVAKVAESLDGKVATATGVSQWITSKAARREGRLLRGLYDGIAVGIGTVLADDPKLTSRLPGRRDPTPIVFDSRLRIPETSALLQRGRTERAPLLIVTGPKAPKGRQKKLEALGATVLRIPAGPNNPEKMHGIVAALYAQGITSLLVEGGPTLLGSLADAGLIDKWHVFIAPRVIGGALAPAAVGGVGLKSLGAEGTLRIESVSQSGPDIHIIAYPK